MNFIEEYKQYHAQEEQNFPGNSLRPQLRHINDLVKDTKAETLLDYGCGKGLQYSEWNHHEHLGVMPALYDPAVPEFEELPDGPFHGVFSTDVLEHVPKEEIPETLHNIYSRAERFVFLGICTRPANTILPNGDNAHCTVEPIRFWKSMVEEHAPKSVYTHIKTYGNCNSYEILHEDVYLEWYIDNV